MKQRRQWMTLLAALALAAALLAGCGGGQKDPADPSGAAPVQDGAEGQKEDAASASADGHSGEEGPSQDAQPGEEAPEETQPEETKPEDAAPDEIRPEEAGAEGAQPEDAAPEEKKDAEPEKTQPADAAPEETQPEEPTPADIVPEDGTYAANVVLEGGTGRATVESPAALRCENGQFWATIVWSSPNFDYMKVDGEKYMQTNTEGNSTFEIPVTAFDRKLDVIADTIAMSEPHEVEYTLTFDSASLQKR